MTDLILSKRIRRLRRKELQGGVLAALRATAAPWHIQPGKSGVRMKLLHGVLRERKWIWATPLLALIRSIAGSHEHERVAPIDANIQFTKIR